MPRTATTATALISPAELATIGSKSQVSALLGALPQYPYDLDKARQEMAQSASRPVGTCSPSSAR